MLLRGVSHPSIGEELQTRRDNRLVPAHVCAAGFWQHYLCCQHLCQVSCAVLCCAVLCCAVLCCAVLCCAVLCCAVLCCAVLCCAVLCCAVLCCAAVPALPCRARSCHVMFWCYSSPSGSETTMHTAMKVDVTFAAHAKCYVTM